MTLLLFIVIGLAQQTSVEQGLLALKAGNLPEARTRLKSAVRSEPKNAVAWASLAETNRRLGDDAAANEAAEKAEQFGGNLPNVEHALAAFYVNEGKFNRAAPLEEKYASSPKADSQALLRAAELYQRAGDPGDAERVLKTAWQKQSTDPLVAFTYSQLLLNKLDFVGAEGAVAAALAAHPQDPQLILVTGVARYGQRRFPDAIGQFLKVIAVDPSIPQPYDFLGKMLEQSGDQLPAIAKAFEARVKAAPDDALANLVLAKAQLLGNPKDAMAESLLRHSLAVDPAQWEAHYELGLLLESKRDFPASAEELSRSIALNAREPMPHYHLARVYDRMGESGKAEAERKLHQQLSNGSQ